MTAAGAMGQSPRRSTPGARRHEVEQPGAAHPSYLVCSWCGLSIRVRFAALGPENCPRCLARSRTLRPLFCSPLPFDELSAATPDQPDRRRRRSATANEGTA